jgi:hypothetical protein
MKKLQALLSACLLWGAGCASVGAAPLSAANKSIDPALVSAQPVLQVGPGRAVRTLREAAKIAEAGSIIEVDAGRYVGDTAVWTQNDLTLRAVDGRVTLVAGGAAAESKGIWVVRAQNMVAEGFDFEGTAVPSRNGAGIRFESGSLRVRDCSFTDNEMGLLTNNDANAVLEIENSEFFNNGRVDAHNHQLYVGRIARLSVTGSYFHHGRVGHLIKSRAAENHLYYNRLTDEVGGSASYELEFPDGGVAIVVGNIIAQGSQTLNPHLIAFGAEGLRWPRSELYLVNNTLVDNLPKGGVFLRLAPGTQVLKAVNNLLVGNQGELAPAKAGFVFNNFSVDWDEFVHAAREDFRLTPKSKLRGKAKDPGRSAKGGPTSETDLTALREYKHPRGISAVNAPARQPGALQQ